MTTRDASTSTPAEASLSPFDQLLLLVGRMNYSWTNTESLLIHLIAGLAGTTKQSAVIIYLTLNTTRARLDLVERLAKSGGITDATRSRILAATAQIRKHQSLRNRYSHSIYSFDTETGAARTITMRIADRKNALKMGQSDAIDASALDRIRDTIEALKQLNRKIWTLVVEEGYPV
ncbi:hypothetical protein CLV79_11043 [Limimaricola soesokkakensis]|uniref:Uncharacterized protein n=1 Tax=Limimaricola soesokkakensis TaxID=1343159 RepID=A0A1X6ZWG4_9RHOB|nr:hypothetical protein [Limimaricola soesokkakensis]PSK83464.1 hypothetical protein CLV79_11043 [Limimaricola soesokkakensis]SLN63836.1 hypothetical protein LOS8367_03107 [Limimaricola soesokkakensis]